MHPSPVLILRPCARCTTGPHPIHGGSRLTTGVEFTPFSWVPHVRDQTSVCESFAIAASIRYANRACCSSGTTTRVPRLSIVASKARVAGRLPWCCTTAWHIHRSASFYPPLESIVNPSTACRTTAVSVRAISQATSLKYQACLHPSARHSSCLVVGPLRPDHPIIFTMGDASLCMDSTVDDLPGFNGTGVSIPSPRSRTLPWGVCKLVSVHHVLAGGRVSSSGWGDNI